MAQKTSVRAAARDAKSEERRAQQALLAPGRFGDSFVNFVHKMGVGADNPTTTARYGFNPVTRNTIQLEWMHRGAWLAGLAIDIVADDMTRAGAEFVSEMPPEDQQAIQRAMTRLGVWDRLGDVVRWGRLYGGCIGVLLVDGQDHRTPLLPDSVAPGQFRGLLVLDRHMLEPDLSDLVTELGPDLGLPKFYRVLDNAPALRGKVVHHTRIALRHVGVELPYRQALTENLWGMSVLERLWDRMTSFDAASAGAGQLVYRAWLRTLKIDGLRDIIAAGGAPMEGVLKYADMMRRYQNMEGITLLDKEDEFDVQEHGAFSGLAEVVRMFGEQVSGALQIPLVRLLGQSPGGLNATGESDLRTYYDHINQQQNRLMHRGINVTYEVCARSEGIDPGEGFGVDFASLWQMEPAQKAEVAGKVTTAVTTAYEKGVITQQAAAKELKQSSRGTGVFTNISDADIAAADDELAMPDAELAMQQQEADHSHEADQSDAQRDFQRQQAEAGRQHQLKLAKESAKNGARPNGQAGPLAGGPRKRNRL